MSKEAKQARADYMRKYRREHPEKQKAYAEAHWERVAKKMAEAAENEQATD